MAASSTVQSVPSQQPISNRTSNSNPIPSPQNPSCRKRALENARSSPYFKMRVVLKDLRPLFLEVIRDPEFQNCKAAHGIQEKMKTMVDLCKQMAMQAPSIVKCNNGEEFVKLEKEESPAALGTSVVGGSAFGWNFITFISSKPEYYGRSKESFRAANFKVKAGEA